MDIEFELVKTPLLDCCEEAPEGGGFDSILLLLLMAQVYKAASEPSP